MYYKVIDGVRISKGLHGEVVFVQNDKSVQYACKIVPIDDGINNLCELCIFKSLKYKHLLELVDIGIDNDMLYMVMPFYEYDLHKYLHHYSCELKFNDKRRICNQVCKAVYVLHSNKYIHGDIKPSNVLVEDDGDSIRVGDFSLSVKGDGSSNRQGTYGYMAPEVFVNDRWDNKTDIWSLGCTFYKIMFNEDLFSHDKDNYFNECLQWNIDHYNIDFCRDKRKPIEHISINSDIDLSIFASFKDLFFQMMHIDPSKRPSTWEIMHHDFFKDFDKTVEYTVTSLTPRHTHVFDRDISNVIMEYEHNQEVIQNVISVLKYVSTMDIYDKKVIMTVYWMVKKMRGEKCTIDAGLDIIKSYERTLGIDLNYIISF